MAVLGSQIEFVNAFQLLDLPERFFRKTRLSFEAMESHPFKEITKRHIQLFGECLKHSQKAFSIAFMRSLSFFLPAPERPSLCLARLC